MRAGGEVRVPVGIAIPRSKRPDDVRLYPYRHDRGKTPDNPTPKRRHHTVPRLPPPRFANGEQAVRVPLNGGKRRSVGTADGPGAIVRKWPRSELRFGQQPPCPNEQRPLTTAARGTHQTPCPHTDHYSPPADRHVGPPSSGEGRTPTRTEPHNPGIAPRSPTSELAHRSPSSIRSPTTSGDHPRHPSVTSEGETKPRIVPARLVKLRCLGHRTGSQPACARSPLRGPR